MKIQKFKVYILNKYAVTCIVNLGPEGELCLIQGITEDVNETVRAKCAVGLAMIGASTLRTLLISLFDESELVRNTVQKHLVSNVTIADVIKEFEGKHSHLVSLRIGLRDLLEKQVQLKEPVVKLFNEILVFINNQ